MEQMKETIKYTKEGVASSVVTVYARNTKEDCWTIYSRKFTGVIDFDIVSNWCSMDARPTEPITIKREPVFE